MRETSCPIAAASHHLTLEMTGRSAGVLFSHHRESPGARSAWPLPGGPSWTWSSFPLQQRIQSLKYSNVYFPFMFSSPKPQIIKPDGPFSVMYWTCTVLNGCKQTIGSLVEWNGPFYWRAAVVSTTMPPKEALTSEHRPPLHF